MDAVVNHTSDPHRYLDYKNKRDISEHTWISGMSVRQTQVNDTCSSYPTSVYTEYTSECIDKPEGGDQGVINTFTCVFCIGHGIAYLSPRCFSIPIYIYVSPRYNLPDASGRCDQTVELTAGYVQKPLLLNVNCHEWQL